MAVEVVIVSVEVRVRAGVAREGGLLMPKEAGLGLGLVAMEMVMVEDGLDDMSGAAAATSAAQHRVPTQSSEWRRLVAI